MTEKTPSNIYNIKINGEDHEVFMSLGLLQTLAKQIGHVTNIQMIPNIILDHEMFDNALKEVLAKRKKSGKVISYIEIDDIEADDKDLNELMKWVVEHLLDFFISRLQTFGQLSESLGVRQKAVTETTTS